MNSENVYIYIYIYIYIYMNVFLNGNLAQMPIMYIEVLFTPKKKPALPLTKTLFCFVSNIAVCIIVYKGCKQSNFFTTTRY